MITTIISINIHLQVFKIDLLLLSLLDSILKMFFLKDVKLKNLIGLKQKKYLLITMNLRLLLYLFATGQKEEPLIQIKDCGVDSLSKLQKDKRSSILEIQLIVRSSKKLDKNSGHLIWQFYQLGLMSLDT